MELPGLKCLVLLTVLLFVLVLSVKCSEDPHPNSEMAEYRNDTNGSKESHGIEIVVFNIYHIKTTLVFTIVLIIAGASKLAFHFANFLSSKVPESCLLIVVGTVLGALIHLTDADDSIPTFFEPHQFFMYLLPPIILESAFSLHDRTFAENLGSVLLFAVIGTILACFMLGGSLYGLAEVGALGVIDHIPFVQMLVFTSLIVAVDPVAVLAVFEEIGVNHVLYFLVFGESLLNDGVTVVLYNVMQAYNLMDGISIVQIILGIVKFFVVCFGGLFLGVTAGLLSALFTRLSTQVKVVQPIIIYGMAYFGFLMAEMFEFSGIISIIGCGLVQVHYSFANINDKSRLAIKYFTKVFSTFSEILIFLFLGLSFVRQGHVWHTGFILWTLLLCLVFRFIITFGMTFMINKFDKNRVRKIGLDEQFMIAYGGLRGAVCFSLVALLKPNEIPQKDLFMTATLAVIVFTGFVQGITIKPLVNLLKIKLAPEKNESMYLELQEHITDHMMAGIEDVMGLHGKYYLKEKIDHIDDTYLKKIFVNTPMKKSGSALMGFYEKIMLKEHLKYLKLCGAKSIPESIPKIDTRLYLSELDENSSLSGDSGGEEENKRDSQISDEGGIVMRRDKNELNKTNMNADDLRSLLKSSYYSRTINRSFYDKNLKTINRKSRHTMLRNKTNQNRSLQRVMSMSLEDPLLERTISWNDKNTDICDQRIREGPNKNEGARSVSVDFSKITATPKVHFKPSNLQTVTEVTNQNADGVQNGEGEGHPLLHDDHSHHHGSMARQNAVDEVPLVVITKLD